MNDRHALLFRGHSILVCEWNDMLYFKVADLSHAVGFQCSLLTTKPQDKVEKFGRERFIPLETVPIVLGRVNSWRAPIARSLIRMIGDKYITGEPT